MSREVETTLVSEQPRRATVYAPKKARLAPKIIAASIGGGLALGFAYVLGAAVERATKEPTKLPTKAPPSPGTAPAPPTIYEVATGDRPHLIARRFLGATFNTIRPEWWAELCRANPQKDKIAPDRWRRLGAGERLTIPPEWKPHP